MNSDETDDVEIKRPGSLSLGRDAPSTARSHSDMYHSNGDCSTSIVLHSNSTHIPTHCQILPSVEESASDS